MWQHLPVCQNTLHSQVTLHSQSTFTHKSPHLSRSCLHVLHWLSLISHFAAVTVPFGTGLPLWHISLFMAQSSCSCELCQLVLRVLCVERPLWAGFASYSICSDTVTCPFGQGRTLHFPVLFVCLKFLMKRACPCKQGVTLINKPCIIPSHCVKVTQFSDTFFYKNKHVILSCGTSLSNSCLRSTRGLP